MLRIMRKKIGEKRRWESGGVRKRRMNGCKMGDVKIVQFQGHVFGPHQSPSAHPGPDDDADGMAGGEPTSEGFSASVLNTPWGGPRHLR